MWYIWNPLGEDVYMATNREFPSPAAIAALGQKIYDERYKAALEENQQGKFVAVNVRTADATVGNTPEQALEEARAKSPDGLFHLVRVGFPSAYAGSSQRSYDVQDWVFGC
jgi:hypothetical protein